MKIVYLSSSTIPSRKANGIHVMKMCQAFAKNGHEIALIGEPGGNKENTNIWYEYGVEECFSVTFCKRPKLGRMGSLFYGARASSIAKEFPADLLYGRCPHSLAWAAKSGIPFIYEAHNLPRGYFRKKIESFLFSRKNFNCLVTISATLKRDYLASFPFLKEEQVIVAHDGADLPESFPQQNPNFSNSSIESFKIGYIGSLYQGRGIEIICNLSTLCPDYEFHIVGGSNHELNYWSDKLNHNVKFYGYIQPSKVLDYLCSFDVLLMPYQENVQTVKYMSPMKMFEYMASKRPIVASKLPVIEEVLEHGKTALLASPENISAWKDALHILKKDAQYRKFLAENAFEELKYKYTWQKRAKSVLARLS